MISKLLKVLTRLSTSTRGDRQVDVSTDESEISGQSGAEPLGPREAEKVVEETNRVFSHICSIIDVKRYSLDWSAVKALVQLSKDLDLDVREKIRKQGGAGACHYWKCPKGVLDRQAATAKEVYGSRRELPEGLVLYRSLELPCDDRARGIACAAMSLERGEVRTLTAGASTSVGYPHYFGENGVLLIIEGVQAGVSLVGFQSDNRGEEREVFLVDDLTVEVIEVLNRDEVSKLFKNAGSPSEYRKWWRGYRLRVADKNRAAPIGLSSSPDIGAEIPPDC